MLNRASSGYLIEIGDEILVFDHGAGAHQNFLRTGYKATDLHTIFFTHLHSDHCLDYARLVHSRWDQGAGQIPDLKVYAPEYMQRMTDLLFEENGVFQSDLNGRLNSPGSHHVYKNRGGVLPRKRPSPQVIPLHDKQVIESTNSHVLFRLWHIRIWLSSGLIGPPGKCSYSRRAKCKILGMYSLYAADGYAWSQRKMSWGDGKNLHRSHYLG